MLKVYQNKETRKIIFSAEEVCLADWTEVIAGSVDAAKEKHVPMVALNGNEVKVDVGSVAHPMVEEHWIEWVAIVTDNGVQIRYLKAGNAPVCKFLLADGETLKETYAYCNLHGLWKA